MARRLERDSALEKEIRERYQYAFEYWSPIHKEGNRDVRFVAGDPWDPADVRAREELEQKRPHVVFDEASQYINQFMGQARQRKISPKVEPGDEQADDDTASQIQGRIYHIEYVSRANAHKMKALKDAATRGYGWLGVTRKYSNATGREKEPVVRGFDNPDSVLMDPGCKEYDCSDAQFCFVHQKTRKSEVKKFFKHADELGSDKEPFVILTEYWRVVQEPVDRVLWIADGTDEGQEIKESELQAQGIKLKDVEILDEREIYSKRVEKYIVQLIDWYGNSALEDDYGDGVQVLDFEEWDDNDEGNDDPELIAIPIIPVLGEEYWLGGSDDQSGANPQTPKRVLLSLIRRARDPMQVLNLCRSNQAELVGMSPKTRYIGYEGQFEGHENEFQDVGSSPLAYLQVKAIVDPTTKTVLPLPRREAWEPPINSLEILAQACQNAIRSAVGQIASPELDKAKSGVALRRLKETGDTASFHLMDNYAMSMEQLGRVLLRMTLKTHDTAREVAVRSETGEQTRVPINAPAEMNGKVVNYDFTKGKYDLTITTGPSYQSQFEARQDYLNNLAASNPQMMMIFGDLITKMMELGPQAEAIIERFEAMLPPQLKKPNQEIDPAASAQMQAMIEQLTAKVNELVQEREAKLLEIEAEDKRNERDNKTKLAIAEINAQVKENIAQLTASMDQIAATMQNQWQAMQGSQAHQQKLEQQNVAHAQQMESQQSQQEHADAQQDRELIQQELAAQTAGKEQASGEEE